MKPTTKEAYQLLHQGSLALSRAEQVGIRVDVGYLQQTHKDVVKEIQDTTRQLQNDPVWDIWRKRFGMKANIGSRPQLATVVFDCLKYPSLYQTEKGKRSTEPKAFKHVSLPFIQKYFRLAKLQKIKSTYLEGILSEVCDGYLHPHFNLHTASSYRSSSSGPNFQNQPIRDKELGPLIRRCFIPRPGRRLIEVDFSGIEVKVAYCYHLDPNMRKYLLDPSSDMHRDTASDLFMLDVNYLKDNKDWAKKTIRDWAKNRFVFPQFYGSVYFQCAPHIWEAVSAKTGEDYTTKLPCGKPIIQHLREKGIKELGECDTKKRPQHGTFEKHVKEVERIFWEERFSVFTQWKEQWYRDYCERGYFDLFTGFRCSGVFKRNQVLNYQTQGAAFHCLLWSFIEITSDIKSRKMRSRLVGQIHDSALGDVPENETQDYLDLCHEIMTDRLLKHWDWIVIPLETESEVCEGSWSNKKVWTRNKRGVWEEAKK